jgi:hypothetical protein
MSRLRGGPAELFLVPREDPGDPKQPSSWNNLRRSPRCSVFRHGIKNREQLTHASGERHFGWFPDSAQSLVEGAHQGIEAETGERTHVEDRAD